MIVVSVGIFESRELLYKFEFSTKVTQTRNAGCQCLYGMLRASKGHATTSAM